MTGLKKQRQTEEGNKSRVLMKSSRVRFDVAFIIIYLHVNSITSVEILAFARSQILPYFTDVEDIIMFVTFLDVFSTESILVNISHNFLLN